MLLEAGFVLFGVGLLGGLGILMLGRTKGKVQHHKQRAKGAPSRGSLPTERHQNINTVAAR
jgi:hypothetical protein